MALWAPFSKIVGITAMTNQVPKSCLTGTLSTGFKGSSFVELAPMLASAVVYASVYGMRSVFSLAAACGGIAQI